jgi:hypothetical protein
VKLLALATFSVGGVDAVLAGLAFERAAVTGRN